MNSQSYLLFIIIGIDIMIENLTRYDFPLLIKKRASLDIY